VRNTRTAVALAATLGGASILAACGSSGSSAGGAAAVPTGASAAAASGASAGASGTSGASGASLAGVCPATVTLQTDWNPESEHGGIYQMIGPNPTIDSKKKTVTGALMAHGQDTGIKFQIRAGGPAIGFGTVTSQMYLDKSITLGYLATDEQARLSVKQPTTAVIAPLNKSPQIIMWDPKTYPDFKTIADIGKTDAKVRYFDGAAYTEYLIGAGILKKSQVDGSYDGTPASFVAAGGKSTQQGFASAEPYIYSHEVKAWDKPVNFQLINDAGYPFYQSQIGPRTVDLAALTPCLTKLVPVLQQAQIDYVADPAAANALILKLVGIYNTGWQYSPGVAQFSVDQQKKLGLVSNGSDGVFGSIDAARVQKIIDIVTPIFAKEKTPVKPGLTPKDLFTDQFLDKSIKLP